MFPQAKDLKKWQKEVSELMTCMWAVTVFLVKAISNLNYLDSKVQIPYASDAKV